MKKYPMNDPFSDLDVVFIHGKDHIRTAAFRLLAESIEEFSTKNR